MVESSLLEILGVNFSSGSQTIINAVDLNLCIFCSPSWTMPEFPQPLQTLHHISKKAFFRTFEPTSKTCT